MRKPNSLKTDIDLAAAETLTWESILSSANIVKIDSYYDHDGHEVKVSEYSSGTRKVLIAFREEDERLSIPGDKKHKTYSKREAIADLFFGGNRTNADEYIMSGLPLNSGVLSEIGRIEGIRAEASFSDLTPYERYKSDPFYAVHVDMNKREREISEEALRQYEEENTELPPPVPKSLDLQELINAPEEEDDYLIAGLLERISTATIVASAKTGKTTFIYNLIRSLVDEVAFLDKFQAFPVNGQVGFVNYELSEKQAQRWFKNVPIRNNSGTVRVWNLRGKTNPFSNPSRKQEFIDEVREANVKVMILDPFSSAGRGRNTLDNDDVKDFFLELEEFKEAAGIECLIIAVHAGHNGTRARGASTMADHPDCIMTLETNGDGVRSFRAVGRDVDVEKGALEFDESTRLLTYKEGLIIDSSGEKLERKILTFLNKNPGSAAGEIDAGVTGKKGAIKTARDSLLAKGLITMEVKQKGRQEYTPVPLSTAPMATLAMLVPGATPRPVAGGGSPLFIGGAPTTPGPEVSGMILAFPKKKIS